MAGSRGRGRSRGIEFDLAGGRGEAAQLAACVRLSVFGVAGLQWHWHTAGRGPQLFQSHSGRSELEAQRYVSRAGGYTRIIKAGFRYGADRRQSREGDRWFESTSLERRVKRTPTANSVSFPIERIRITTVRGPVVTLGATEWIAALERRLGRPATAKSADAAFRFRRRSLCRTVENTLSHSHPCRHH
jgi:hypothetical protein